MLTKMFPFLDPVSITPGLADRLRALADDCERLRRRGAVSSMSLQTAPVIDDWATLLTPLGIQLTGHVIGHPLLGDRAIVTSPVWFADPNGAWIRTLSRFYRLGTPLTPDEIEIFRAVVEPLDVHGNSDDDSEDRA